ncbi:hypothetical protein [Methylomicrobium sp. Wu6]|uniref:hypothetical protein n=1 Tax=Methylomicrobium sp. Wu6 TaxID=3107928 RepID=UPI002DD6AC37|nr:hypothetical protein [Methylomicrobium sp. Wu6]MEC4747533.1 hypothetical protein [Methylomicrobium sp. Wu6]
MIEQIPCMTPPEWLMNLTAGAIVNNPFPLNEVLQDSLYYPGAGTDGKPVRWLAGNVYSFVYTDYMVSRPRFLHALNNVHSGFRGYRVLGLRDMTMKELIPNGWVPQPPNVFDGNPNEGREHFAEPFGIWGIMERLPDYPAEHGPERFSLLYLCGEGVASYQALYNSNRLKPKILFLIQHGFGGNWTNFENPDGIFAQSVAANPVGMPDWLVGRYRRNYEGSRESYWPKYYPGQFLYWLGGGHDFAVWALGNQQL